MRKSKYTDVLTKELLEQKYKDLKTIEAISENMEISIDTISKYLKLFNINYSKHYQRQFNVNDDFFKNDTPENQYVAGFIAADGCILNKSITKIGLQLRDKCHLEMINNLMDSTFPIKIYKYSKLPKNGNTHYCQLSISSQEIVNDLLKWNIGPRKSLKYEMPNWLLTSPNINHFIRGYFDGDGCISRTKSKSRKVWQKTASIIATKNFCNQINDLGILNKVKLIKHYNMFVIPWSGNNNIRKLGEFLYKDCNNIFLKRKFDRFELT